jgi:hypothetical protein
VTNAWGRRWTKTDLPITVYKGRDGRRSGVIAIPEEEAERSRLTALGGSAHVQALEVEGSHLMTWKRYERAQVQEVEEAMVSELSLPKPVGMCYRHNLTWSMDGPRATWVEGSCCHNLQIGL